MISKYCSTGVSTEELAPPYFLDEMNRDYINWLESLPCNRKRQTVNQWMAEWAPLPDEIDLPRYEETQQRSIERDCPDGVMARLKQWLANKPS